jgi:hypothetical protein
MAMTPLEVARRFYACFNDRLFDEGGALVHPEATFHYVPTKQHLVGRAGYRALVAAWIIAFEDARLEIATLQQLDEHTVRIDFIGRGTQTGDLTLGEDFVIPATGTESELAFRDTLTIRNGLIHHSQLEFDAVEMRRRLTESIASKV